MGKRRDIHDTIHALSKAAANGCRIWTGTTIGPGYGRIARQEHGKRVLLLAHRAWWEAVNGPIPEGMVVRHRCDNPSCVQIGHLILGTQADNMADMADRGRANRTRGGRHSRFTEAEKRAILTSGAEPEEIARSLGVHRATVYRWMAAADEEQDKKQSCDATTCCAG